MFAETFEWDDAEEILRGCETGFIPCGATGAAAIEAHSLAWSQHQIHPTGKSADVVRCALHAVLCARPRTSGEAGAVLEYFQGLRSEAWQNVHGDEPERYREFAVKQAAERLRLSAS
jgi:hypothetical protein